MTVPTDVESIARILRVTPNVVPEMCRTASGCRSQGDMIAFGLA
jgi:hypothetical protein